VNHLFDNFLSTVDKNCAASGRTSKCSEQELEEYSIPTLDFYGDNDNENVRKEYVFFNRYAINDCYEVCLNKFTCVAFLHDRASRLGLEILKY